MTNPTQDIQKYKAGNASVVQLPSGLTVIHQQMPTPAVVVDVWVRAGASTEPADGPGMAHFLEHMVFKGTERLQPGEFDWAIESRGGVTNAATSHDYAHFYIAVAASALSETLPYLAELLLQAAIPADEFVRERDVVLEEIRQAHDDPDWVGYQVLCEMLYGDHAYSQPVLGTPESLMAMSPEDMRQFYRAHYQPHNMTVAIAGNLPEQTALDLVQQSFTHFTPATSASQSLKTRTLKTSQPEQSRRTLRLPNLEQSRLTMAWMGPGIEKFKEASGLDLIAVLLGGGSTSRLVQELREEKQLVQDIEVDFSLQQDCGVMSICVWLEHDDIEKVEEIVRDRLRTLATKLVAEAELARCKRLLLNDYAFSSETPGQIAGMYGYYATVAKPALALTYPDHIAAHSAASLQQLAQRYLNAERYTAVILQPAD